ncbi:hypothetical protein [Novosphingobium soli]|uniref:DUF2312 domain-containing protein n=1 Tax=Novosphingobium soli TaxID=574956 RepID=A0ABV6CV55_9SPHN
MTDMPLTRGRRPIPGLAESEDQVLAMIAALASELAVARERIDTLERLLAERGVLEMQAVERYAPAVPAQAERDVLRRRIIAKVFQPLRDSARREAEAMKGERLS